PANLGTFASPSIEGCAIYKKVATNYKRSFQKLRERYWGQQLWAREYFVATPEQISATEVQKYIKEQYIL
ncbi:MAG: transposase, partial [Alphaproteobacteria bacterium]|nr:transposase [Alphaproteobacteria bacterium]